MSYFKINTNYNIIENKNFLLNINYLSQINIDDLVHINESLYYYLKNSKEQINLNIKNWDLLKKYTNPYEFIHTSYDKNNYISKKKPLSRAYYKMIEIIKYYDIFKKYKDINIKSFHLAEGPGGFIEAFVDIRKQINDKYYGLTLINSNDATPGWKKSKIFLKNNPNVIIETGKDNGNLYSYDNLRYIIDTHSNSCDIVTGDGGFDFSIDFSCQEINALRLIYSQLIFAFNLQKDKGIFIIKVFDIFTKGTIDLVYLLSYLYEELHICKPKTSRYANSEKYIICINFDRERFLKISDTLENIFIQMQSIDFTKKIISSFLNIDYNYNFKKNVQEINSLIGEQQLNVINNTITMMKKSINNCKNEKEKKLNIMKCIDWCIEHNIPHNNYKKSNIFTN